MAHQEQADFCRKVLGLYPNAFKSKIVVDIGSLDINGNNREFFDNCLYLGVDIAEGKNVDLVTTGGKLGLPDNSVDVVISTECFEHDRFYVDTIQNIVRILKPGGLFLFTCATTGRPEHGTARTTPQNAPLLQGIDEWSDYYCNLEEHHVRQAVIVDKVFSKYEFATNPKTCDLYFYGFKQGEAKERTDYSFMLHQEPLIKSLAELTNERDMLLAERKELLEKKSELESMLSGIFNSNSWKITKPLRAVMGSWKNLI